MESPEFVAADMHYQFVELIQAELKRRGMTRQELAKLVGVTDNYLGRVMRPESRAAWLPTLRTIGTLLAALGLRVTVEALVVEAAE